MAEERESDSTEPAGSETLLDAVLRTLYDLGETEGETEPKRIRKKREKKRGEETIADETAEPLPLPECPARSQKKNASSFFKELKAELHSAPAVPSAPPSGPEVPATTAVSLSPLKNSGKLVEVVAFQSRSKKRKPKSDQDEHTKNKTKAFEKDVGIQEFNLEKCHGCGAARSKGCWELLGARSDCCASTGSSGSTSLWDHRLRQRKRESPGTGAGYHAGG
ncbi:hypothetical protein NN561_015266 [Cricetulus griseus]